MKNLFVFIFNAIFTVICIAAIALYFILPLWKVSVTYNITEEQLNEMLGNDIDFTTSSGQGVDVKVDLRFDSIHMISSVADGDAQKTAERIVDDNLDSIVNQISASISEVTKEVVQTVATDTVKTEIKTQIKEFLNSSSSSEEEDEQPIVTDERVQELLDNAGVDDDYIAEKVEAVIEEIYQPDATVDKICDEATNVAREAYSKLQESEQEEFSDLEFTAENEQSIRDIIADILQEVADEDGNVNAEEFVNALILEVMKALNDSGAETNSAAIAPLSAVSLASNDTTSSENSKDEIKAEIRQYILSIISLEELNTVFLITFIAIAAILCISLLSWLYLLIKLIVKFFTKNHSVKLKCPIILGWLPFLILYVLPTIAMLVLPRFIELPAITVSFFSSGIFAFAAAVILIILWIPYRVIYKNANK